jgi:DNA-binding FadR family transcriptional regulator
MTTSAQPRTSVPDQIFVRLCEAILSGRYEPGDALPTQRRLALEFDANLSSVREATARLEQLHLIEVRHGSAMRVLDWRRHGGVDVIGHVLLRAGGFDRATLAHVLEARRLLLTESARLAATRRELAQADRLAELAESIGTVADDDEAQRLDFAFFEELIDAAGNLLFVLIMNTVRDLYLAGAALYRGVVSDRREHLPRYRAIAQAVRDGDGDAAADATSELAKLQEKRMLEALA